MGIKDKEANCKTLKEEIAILEELNTTNLMAIRKVENSALTANRRKGPLSSSTVSELIDLDNRLKSEGQVHDNLLEELRTKEGSISTKKQ